MKQLYKLLTTVLLSAAALPAVAQYEFKDAAGTGTNGLGPYTQNFDGLANTKAIFTSNTTLKGVYARFVINGTPGEYESSVRGSGPQAKLGPDDGSEGPNASSVDVDGTPHGASWYHFGAPGESDRALGGIASTTIAPGEGYIGIRLKNSTAQTSIKNLEIRYAMEQWYNSSQTQAASVTVDYKRNPGNPTSPTAAYLSGTTGWTSISALNVAAPSTSTAIAPRNGNADTNRRILQATLADINLAPNEEIMIRWKYTFDSNRNGNGLSIDDVVITPQTNIFYSSLTADLDDVNSWTTGADGSGAKPANFTADNQTFYVRGTNGTTTRVQRGSGWTVSGTNSKVIVGIPASPAIGNVPAKPAVPASLFVDAGNKTIVAPIDVAEGSTLRIDKIGTALTLGYLAPTSTVEYRNATGTHTLLAANYGNIVLTGAGGKVLGRNLVASGTLDLSNASKLTLGNYDLTLLRPATNVSTYGGSVLNAGSTAYIVAAGTGRLRQSVPNSNVNIFFPVGTASSYTPVKLRQSAATSEDVYGVRMLDNTYPQYTSAEAGTGTPVAFQNVKKTWLIDEEVDGNSNITMTLQWNKTDATADFVTNNAHINHYVNGNWDRYTSTLATTTVSTDVYAVQRDGIMSFSPFAISSRPNGVLPVSLVLFVANRIGAEQVQCNWQTASELNNDYFSVERSLDGKQFAAIGTVKGAGTTSRGSSYTFVDAKALAATAYYRLRQVDFDGTAAYSPVVVVKGCTDCTTELSAPSVVPNPGLGRFEVQAANGSVQPLYGSVLNVLGQEVVKLNGETTFDLSAYPAGVYLVRLQAAAGPQRVLRVVKQ